MTTLTYLSQKRSEAAAVDAEDIKNGFQLRRLL